MTGRVGSQETLRARCPTCGGTDLPWNEPLGWKCSGCGLETTNSADFAPADAEVFVAAGMATLRAHRARLGAINAEAFWEGVVESALRDVAGLRAVLAVSDPAGTPEDALPLRSPDELAREPFSGSAARRTLDCGCVSHGLQGTLYTEFSPCATHKEYAAGGTDE